MPNTASARTAPVCAWPAGTGATARWLAAPGHVTGTGGVWSGAAGGSASARTDGKVLTVLWSGNVTATMEEIMMGVSSASFNSKLLSSPYRLADITPSVLFSLQTIIF